VLDGSAPEGGAFDAVDQAATDIEEALHTALFGFAPHHAKRLVLLTDGNQTQGDVWRLSTRLRAEGVRVFAFPAAPAATQDAWIEALALPPAVRSQEPIGVTLKVFSATATRARIELRQASRLLAARTVTLPAAESEVRFETRLPSAGRNTLTARVAADGDQVPENDVLTQDVWVLPRPRVLYVEHNLESAHYLSDALEHQGIDVRVATVSEWTADPGLLSGMDAIVLSDIPAESIDAGTAQRLERFVRDAGGGLVFAAGDNTYGKAGYSESDVERLLPVKFEARRKRRDLDLVLLIDRSHSMRGRKLELAKSAALASLDLLDAEHRLGVVAFDAKPHDVVPLAAVGTKRFAEDRIASMTSSGQTNIYAALLRAQDMLAASPATTKHVILLSDGQTAAPRAGNAHFSSSEAAQDVIRRVRADTVRREDGVMDAPGEPASEVADGFSALMAELAAEQVTLSTVAIGEKPNLALMSELAQGANGKSYVAQSDAEIPGLFVAETRRLLGESIVERRFRPLVKTPGAAIAGVDFSRGPELKGFVAGRPKQFSDVLLEAEANQPLLAETRYGLGKTVVFLSDVKNRWAADWLGWPGYAQLWAQVVRTSMRRGDAPPLEWRVTRQGREVLVSLAGLNADGSYRNGISPRVRVGAPDGGTAVMPLRQVASGRYETRMQLAAAHSRPHRFELLAGGGLTQQELAQAGTRSVFYTYSDEYRMLPANARLLKALSEQTGGAFAAPADEIFAVRGDGGRVLVPLWRYFAGAALLCFLLDILVRRAPWPIRSTLRAYSREMV
jgi:uncharacterized membrane protein